MCLDLAGVGSGLAGILGGVRFCLDLFFECVGIIFPNFPVYASSAWISRFHSLLSVLCHWTFLCFWFEVVADSVRVCVCARVFFYFKCFGDCCLVFSEVHGGEWC